MTDFVVNASVAIKWVIEEPGSGAALGLRQHQLFAPDLLAPECANILWKKVRRGELTAEEAGLAARLLAPAEVELEPTLHLMEQGARPRHRARHPAYDCVYLALAETQSCAFVTADAHLFRNQ